jgi:hypothetical protein
MVTEDWSYNLINAEKTLKNIGKNLLHVNYSKIDADIIAIISDLIHIRLWIDQANQREADLNEARLKNLRMNGE